MRFKEYRMRLTSVGSDASRDKVGVSSCQLKEDVDNRPPQKPIWIRSHSNTWLPSKLPQSWEKYYDNMVKSTKRQKEATENLWNRHHPWRSTIECAFFQRMVQYGRDTSNCESQTPQPSLYATTAIFDGVCQRVLSLRFLQGDFPIPLLRSPSQFFLLLVSCRVFHGTVYHCLLSSLPWLVTACGLVWRRTLCMRVRKAQQRKTGARTRTCVGHLIGWSAETHHASR